MNKTSVLCAALGLAFASAANATTITLVNNDAAGQGLNDTTPRAPQGGNSGTTVGQQRVIAYQFAADKWESVLVSNVEIKVGASFAALTCTATSGVLGSAGTVTVHRDWTTGTPPVASTWYGAALANSLAGVDLDTTNNDINSRFNANLGNTGCLEGSGWYYGLDGNTPAGQISFLDVVMHEIGHGLNFQGFYSLTTGARFSGFDDIYSSKVRDNNSGMMWSALTDAERVTAATGGNLVFTGANTIAAVPANLNGQVNLFILGNRPADFPQVPAAYGPAPTTSNFTAGDIVRGKDTTGGTMLGCSAYPANAFTGKTVLIDRGTCSFKTKTLNAQNAGAAKVIIANNTSGFPGMGDDTTITATISIPSVGITQLAGNEIKKRIIPGVRGNLQAKPGQFAGTDTSGRPFLYAPNPVAGGSSFSHFDTLLTPNALMEPFINDDLNAAVDLDLTPALFKDLGWVLQP